MANAKKCDRCGKLYEIPRESRKIGVSRDTNKSGYKFMDLCPDCQSSLEDWIERKKTKEPDAPIYGVYGLTDKSTALTRTDDAVGLSFEIDRSSGAISSDFNDVFPWNVAEVVNNGSGKFVSFPEMYFRIGTNAAGDMTDVAVSAQPSGSGNWYRVAPFMYGCYGASISEDKMRSVSGAERAGNRTREQFRDLAFSTGDGYIPIDLYHRNVLVLLWWIEFATKDSRSIMTGRIYNSGTEGGCSRRPCGGTDGVPTPSGFETAYGQMRYHFIEDFIGNVWEMVDGISMSGEDEHDYVTNIPANFSDKHDGKSALPWLNPSDGVVAAYGWDPDNPFLFMPIATVDNDDCDTYFCNYVFHYAGDPVVLAGAGYYGAYANYGLSCVGYASATCSGAYCGSRLLKIS